MPAPSHRVYRTTDGGGHWRASELPIDTQISFAPFDLAFDRDGAALYLLGYASISGFCDVCSWDVLLRSDDGGASWRRLDLPTPSGATRLRPDPGDATTLYLADAGTLYRSDDRGSHWQAVGATPDLIDLLVDPKRPDTLYQATGHQGVLRSANGGLDWAPLGAGLAAPEGWRLAEVTAGPDLLFDATPGGAWVLPLDAVPGGSGASGAVPPPVGPILTSADFPGFRFQVRITDTAGHVQPVRREESCLAEALCVSGALPGRTEVLVRIVGPKPNGRLWPTLVKLTTSRVEVWIEQLSTNLSRYYSLAAARPGVDELPGLFDRDGFPP